jgi:hypothetical protein
MTCKRSSRGDLRYHIRPGGLECVVSRGRNLTGPRIRVPKVVPVFHVSASIDYSQVFTDVEDYDDGWASWAKGLREEVKRRVHARP